MKCKACNFEADKLTEMIDHSYSHEDFGGQWDYFLSECMTGKYMRIRLK